ncbi:TPA: hypothetical protein JGU28_002487 [Salmonella enterica]|nr:hypothetical protein [Salmonella enterica]
MRVPRASGDKPLYPQGLDFLYFLIEPIAEPFVEGLTILEKSGPADFSYLLEMIDHEMQQANS